MDNSFFLSQLTCKNYEILPKNKRSQYKETCTKNASIYFINIKILDLYEPLEWSTTPKGHY